MYMKSISASRRSQAGAVSLFVVVFAMLLITVVTTSFLRLMMNDQNQASNADLSRSAYDSSMAGVEDAKRALILYKKTCIEQGQAACSAMAARINRDECNAALKVGNLVNGGAETGGTGGKPGEIRVQQSNVGDRVLDQAYTCVKVSLETPDYTGTLGSGTSQLVPLTGISNFDSVTLSWFSLDDVSNGRMNLPATGQYLNEQSAWPTNRPPVMRAQLMQFGSGFRLSDFDVMTPSGESNANTLFLYPTSRVSAASREFTVNDPRATTSNRTTPIDSELNTPLPVRCQANIATSGGYSCSVRLVLPTPIGGGDRTAYLRLTTFYGASHYQVTLNNGTGGVVNFKDIQPAIDSTGRANDAFRRVVTRVGLVDTAFPYPEAAVDLTGNFCKDFGVTPTAYIDDGTCVR